LAKWSCRGKKSDPAIQILFFLAKRHSAMSLLSKPPRGLLADLRRLRVLTAKILLRQNGLKKPAKLHAPSEIRVDAMTLHKRYIFELKDGQHLPVDQMRLIALAGREIKRWRDPEFVASVKQLLRKECALQKITTPSDYDFVDVVRSLELLVARGIVDPDLYGLGGLYFSAQKWFETTNSRSMDLPCMYSRPEGAHKYFVFRKRHGYQVWYLLEQLVNSMLVHCFIPERSEFERTSSMSVVPTTVALTAVRDSEKLLDKTTQSHASGCREALTLIRQEPFLTREFDFGLPEEELLSMDEVRALKVSQNEVKDRAFGRLSSVMYLMRTYAETLLRLRVACSARTRSYYLSCQARRKAELKIAALKNETKSQSETIKELRAKLKRVEPLSRFCVELMMKLNYPRQLILDCEVLAHELEEKDLWAYESQRLVQEYNENRRSTRRLFSELERENCQLREEVARLRERCASAPA